MKILDIVKNWFNKKDVVEIKTDDSVVAQQNTNTVDNTDLQAEIKRLNSRISFITEKMEKMTQQNEQMLCQMEQVLFHTSGSFHAEENDINKNIETKIKNDKNVVNIRYLSHLN